MENQTYKPPFRSDYVSRVCRNRDEAERAYQDLHSKGYTTDDVNLLMTDKTRHTHFTNTDRDTDLGNKVAENAGTRSLIGGGVGAVIGAVCAIGSNVLLPGLGLVVAGPLAAG